MQIDGLLSWTNSLLTLLVGTAALQKHSALPEHKDQVHPPVDSQQRGTQLQHLQGALNAHLKAIGPYTTALLKIALQGINPEAHSLGSVSAPEQTLPLSDIEADVLCMRESTLMEQQFVVQVLSLVSCVCT